VIVVDDESPEPVPASVRGALLPGRFTLLRVPRGGPGAARNAGARVACGLVVIFVDDDMRLPPDFIEAHLAHFRPHFGPMVVLGNIQADADIAAMPLFERYHARQLARFQDGAIRGSVKPRGVHLCTGNVSMRLADFLDVGGFDTSLARSEDRELGIRLEQRGCRFAFGQHAISMHGSDHRDPAVWRRRNELYGRADLIIARKHPATPAIHPWRFWTLIPSFGRPLALATLLAPRLGQVVATAVFAIARALDAPTASTTSAGCARRRARLAPRGPTFVRQPCRKPRPLPWFRVRLLQRRRRR
jgi:GT2 family glycosyltransferase